MKKNKSNKFYLILMIVFWLILTESIDMQMVLTGIAICFLVFFINVDILEINFGYSFKNKKKLFYLLKYLLLLCKEIVFANFHVAKIVLSKNSYRNMILRNFSLFQMKDPKSVYTQPCSQSRCLLLP